MVSVVIVGWLLIRSLQRTERPGRLIFKWILTFVIVSYMVRKLAPAVGGGSPSAAVGAILFALLCGLVLAITWRHNLADMFAKPFESLYDGGSAEIEPQAYYSIAESKRKRGFYDDAIAEIRKQLTRFPKDLQGNLLLAEIQAENLNDLSGAQVTIERFCNQKGHTAREIAVALNALADWQLKYGVDREAAQQSLEKIIRLFPNTDVALAASQRIAHLGSVEQLMEPHARSTMPVRPGITNVGLLESSAHLAPAEADPEQMAEELANHLVNHPLDSEARERLAVIYAEHYGRLDLASDQLEQLIDLPNQPIKSVAHWLNLLADLQIRGGADYATVRETLERIVERFPNHSAASLAQNRINTLTLEFKAREKSPSVRMGTYEQNIGLKQGTRGPV